MTKCGTCKAAIPAGKQKCTHCSQDKRSKSEDAAIKAKARESFGKRWYHE